MKHSVTTRILSILDLLVGASTRLGSGTPITQVLASVLNAEINDLARLHLAYSRIVSLCSDAIDEVELCFDDETLSDELRQRSRQQASAPLRQVFQVLANNSVMSQVAVFSSIPLGEVRILALVTSQRLGREDIAVERIEQLRESIADLRAAIVEADLPDTLKAYLLSILREMERAIDEYQVFGADEIANKFGKLLATISSLRDQEEGGVNAKIWEKLSRIGALLSVIQFGVTYGPTMLKSAARLLKP